MKRMVSVLVLCGMVFLLFAGCNRTTTNQVITYEGDTIPTTVDPLLASTQSELLVMYHLFDPLFQVDEQGRVTPASAEGYTFSSNGLTCTVTLKEGLVWSNEQPVTAHDFVFALQRAADPATKATCAGELSCIQGAEAVLAGKQPPSSLGVRAVSDTTLELQVTVADRRVLALLAGPAGMPCNQAFFESCGGRYGMDRQSTVTNGMFTIQGWSGEEPDVFMRLTRFDHYYNKHTIAPAGLYFTVGDPALRSERLGDGKMDCGEIAGEQAAEYEQQGYQTISYDEHAYALIFNTKNQHLLQDDSLRKAMAGSIDVEQLKQYLPSYFGVSNGLLLPQMYYGVTPYVSKGYNHDRLQKAVDENFMEATQHVQPDVLQQLTLWYVEEEGITSFIDYVIQCWQKELGVYVTAQAVSFAHMQEGVQAGAFDMAVYPTATVGNSSLSVLEQFAFQGQNPLNGFTDKTYDEYLQKAQNSLAGQQLCETYLLDHALAVPLYTTKNYYVFGKKCVGMQLNGYTHQLRMETMKKEN